MGELLNDSILGKVTAAVLIGLMLVPLFMDTIDETGKTEMGLNQLELIYTNNYNITTGDIIPDSKEYFDQILQIFENYHSKWIITCLDIGTTKSEMRKVFIENSQCKLM